MLKKSVKKNKSKKSAKISYFKKLAPCFPKKSLPLKGIKRTKIRVIGVGGGGGSIVSEIALTISKASFVVANTDVQALKEASQKTLHFQFGQDFTQGLGTGMNPEVGRDASQKEKEKIKKLLEGQDCCVIIACLGGGAGSGAAPVFAKISKECGNITYGIFTLPFKFEGQKKMEIAKEALKKLKPYLNAISIIPNERIFQIVDKKIPLKQALSTVNKNLIEDLQGLIEVIYEVGLINIDFADFKTILDGQGKLTYLNTIEFQGNNRAEEVFKKAISSPLYPYSINGAKGILFNIFGEKNLGLAEVCQISKNISELVDKEAKIIFGISESKKYCNKLKITLLATGCKMKDFFEKVSPVKDYRKKETAPIEQISNGIDPHFFSKGKLKKQNSAKSKKKQGKKIEIKSVKKLEKQEKKSEKQKEQNRVSNKEEIKNFQPSKIKIEKKEIVKKSETKARRNALQIKKDAEEVEKEMLLREEVWETPAFLRRKLDKNEHGTSI